ncbi:N-acyl-D-amino-acid deacylase family protein [Haloglycomyces albus]|uniref:N-acyl-D-amino-acid deacylase family protein n=1 Tax=Haloglycomyces albus TaxID=526067 RepID=UPI0004A34BA7|nr:D-aminoacylase [Haloglycomyces albus]
MLLIKNATVVDGTGRAAQRGDVAVSGGIVHSVGTDLPTPRHGRVIDATGLTVTPGFIDMHAHSDLAALDSDHEGKIAQGCTTEVVGQDGLSYVPSTDGIAEELAETLSAWNGPGRPPWRTVADYLNAADEDAVTNLAYLLPHGTIRMAAMGWQRRPPTAVEMEAMHSAVTVGMRQGAFGLSAGLTYAPGMYADTDELVELCRVVGRHHGFFAPHQRSYGAGALDGYREMLDIGRQSGCAVHLAHATMNFPVNAGRAEEFLTAVDQARHSGVDVSLDSYPYLAGMTKLSALLPGWAVTGDLDEQLRLLADPDIRQRIVHDLDVVGSDGAHGVPVDWDGIEIAGVVADELRHLSGTTVSAASGSRSSAEYYLDLLIADRLRSTCLMHVGHEDNLRRIMRHETHTGSSDGLLHGSRLHPRAWGSFPQYLGRYVREENVLSLEECVHHLTGRAARRLGLVDRGTLQPGAAADIAVFDADQVAATATFTEAKQRPVGIPYVFVNGEAVVDDGDLTGRRPGHALRRPTG